MANIKQGSAGVSANEVDVSAPAVRSLTGTPACVIGTANRGPAFVPVTVGSVDEQFSKFGQSDGEKFGPIAASEWLRNASSLTYVRVLGAGDGKTRNVDGSVTSAGFVVGENQPSATTGLLAANPYANAGGVPGRTYFLGTFMSESAGSTVFSRAGLQNSETSVPIIRGILFAASGVILKLSSSVEVTSSAPASTLVASNSNVSGSIYGATVLLENGVAKQDFVMLLNGHKGTDPLYPNVISASFDMTAPNYFGNILNKDPYNLQQSGHYLYTYWDIHPCTAVVTGAGNVSILSGAGATTAPKSGAECCAFLTTSSLAYNVGSSTVPNYETFNDRFSYAKSPWVTSQKFGGKSVNLFRLHSLDAGSEISTQYKVLIENIAPSSDPAYKYGTFDLVLRDWSDTDNNQVPVEQWRGLSLDPASSRYICKIVGDINEYFDFDRSDVNQRLTKDGAYDNVSTRVRVEVSSDVDTQSVDPEALPLGFRGPAHLVTSGSAPLMSPSSNQLDTATTALKKVIEAPLPFRSTISIGTGAKTQVNPFLCWGVQFEHVTSLTSMNSSTQANKSLNAWATYFPDFATSDQPFCVGDNEGVADTAANGVLDADRFCNNGFTLENLKIVTGSNGVADPAQWLSASYIRDGNITTDDTLKYRRLSVDDFTQANRKYLKYCFFMQGGFNGLNIFNRDEAQLNDNAVAYDMLDTSRGLNNGPNVKAYTKAIEVINNVSAVDIQLLAVPGIRTPVVTDTAAAAVKDRFDALYIMDIEQMDTSNAAIRTSTQRPSVQYTVDQFKARSIDTSFAAAYFPDVVVTDPTTKTNVVVPPSVAVLGAFAINDSVGHPWLAPAGFTRGALQTTLEANVKLSKGNMDVLYDASINPIVAFPGNVSSLNPTGGVVVWGQKTLQAAASALDRVNVRRLLINIRRQVRDIARTFLFEPNRETTLAAFSATVNPKLRRVQQLAGIEKFRVAIDTSTTTQEDVLNNTIRGKIYVQPAKSIEFVSLDFVVTNNINQVG